VEINDPAVAALAVAAERDGWGQFDVAVGDIHTAESFPDSLLLAVLIRVVGDVRRGGDGPGPAAS